VLLRLAYLGVTNVFGLLRLLPMSSRDKDAEILALRHQLSVLQRQLGPDRMRFTPGDRAFWRHCCTGSRGTCLRDCTWWCGRIPCSAGTAMWPRVGTSSGPGPGTRAGRAPCARFAS
jgi:hypothetical protein